MLCCLWTDSIIHVVSDIFFQLTLHCRHFKNCVGRLKNTRQPIPCSSTLSLSSSINVTTLSMRRIQTLISHRGTFGILTAQDALLKQRCTATHKFLCYYGSLKIFARSGDYGTINFSSKNPGNQSLRLVAVSL